jgi:hypothetical protein
MEVINILFVKKAMFLALAFLLIFNNTGFAIDGSEELLSLVNLTPATATQSKITSLLGKPLKIEETKKRTIWYYTHGNTNLVISWDIRTTLLEKFSFTCNLVKKDVFDSRLQAKLTSGVTDILQALKILGTPKDMTIKKATQEMHYAYAHNVLRLFFRNRVLVDYCLY